MQVDCELLSIFICHCVNCYVESSEGLSSGPDSGLSVIVMGGSCSESALVVPLVIPPPPGPKASRSATSFCFSANIVLRVFSWLSSFSIESSELPSGAAESCDKCKKTTSHVSGLTLAFTQELSSPTLPSSLFQHSTKVVIRATHSLAVSWTLPHLTWNFPTWSSASWW